MTQTMARAALAALSIILSALYGPLLYDKLLGEDIETTHLLYSPVLDKFVWKESARGHDHASAYAEDHHAGIIYTDEDGMHYSRQDFEKLLPFIYYKNMELWGLLPLEIGPHTFTKAQIKESRQVLELHAADMPGRRPSLNFLPLLESNPGQARLVFPKDRFRLTPTGMEFVDADTNQVDHGLSQTFTQALKQAGFRFPAKQAASKPSILKPFDAGVLLVDQSGAVFQLKRVDGRPRVVRTPIAPGPGVRAIKVSENRRREFLGLLVDHDGRAYLIQDESFALIPLELPGYDPDSMNLKILLNPLYATAVYADQQDIHGVAMDREYFQPLRSYTHRMAKAAPTWRLRLRQLLFPFHLELKEAAPRGHVHFRAGLGGWLSLLGMLASWRAYVLLRRRRGQKPSRTGELLAGLTGLYGLLATLIFLEDA